MPNVSPNDVMKITFDWLREKETAIPDLEPKDFASVRKIFSSFKNRRLTGRRKKIHLLEWQDELIQLCQQESWWKEPLWTSRGEYKSDTVSDSEAREVMHVVTGSNLSQQNSNIICGNVSEPIPFTAALRRRKRGFDWVHCNVCSEKVELPDENELLHCIEMELNNNTEFTKWAGGKQAALYIVFTDVTGSTEISYKNGNETMSRVWERHTKRVIELLAASEGRGRFVKDMGDGFLVVFKELH